jgi:hypothetical protein
MRSSPHHQLSDFISNFHALPLEFRYLLEIQRTEIIFQQNRVNVKIICWNTDPGCNESESHATSCCTHFH